MVVFILKYSDITVAKSCATGKKIHFMDVGTKHPISKRPIKTSNNKTPNNKTPNKKRQITKRPKTKRPKFRKTFCTHSFLWVVSKLLYFWLDILYNSYRNISILYIFRYNRTKMGEILMVENFIGGDFIPCSKHIDR